MIPEKTRGIINKNPGNIRKSADKWQGLTVVQGDPAFFQFDQPTYGIRAIARILITHQDRDGCRSITDHINKWAPPNENNTGGYIAAVSNRTGLDPSVPLDMHSYAHLKPMVRAIIMQECAGYQYDDAVMDKGLVLAGVEPPIAATLQATGTVKGGQVAMVTTAVAAPVMGIIQQFQDTLNNAPWVGDLMRFAVQWQPKIMITLGFVGIGAIGFMLWRRIDDHRRGLR